MKNKYIYDSDLEVYGKIIDDSDIHNIIVEYDNGGRGLYCLDKNCLEFDESLKFVT